MYSSRKRTDMDGLVGSPKEQQLRRHEPVCERDDPPAAAEPICEPCLHHLIEPYPSEELWRAPGRGVPRRGDWASLYTSASFWLSSSFASEAALRLACTLLRWQSLCPRQPPRRPRRPPTPTLQSTIRTSMILDTGTCYQAKGFNGVNSLVPHHLCAYLQGAAGKPPANRIT
jgi:hypothetical protein